MTTIPEIKVESAEESLRGGAGGGAGAEGREQNLKLEVTGF